MRTGFLGVCPLPDGDAVRKSNYYQPLRGFSLKPYLVPVKGLSLFCVVKAVLSNEGSEEAPV